MNPVDLASGIEERYRRYLQTTFYFRDPDLRASFQEVLASGHLSQGPYLEATPVFRRERTTRELVVDLLNSPSDEGFLKALMGDRHLYAHQEEAICKVFEGHNVVVATGTASGKTEAFLFPILLRLYQEFCSGTLGAGVRALVLYPMNALANDQRERLGKICERLQQEESPFRFTFGQYIGETPEDENDSRRNAADHIARRLPGNGVRGELVLRSEMRKTPPHILLTNYSMLEYLLLRPHDSPLFDNGRATWWSFLVLDEAHQYRGARGIEMAMLLRRLKQRLREGGQKGAFRCIATSATLAAGEQDKGAVAKFAEDLFGETFPPDDVILGETEPIPDAGPSSLSTGQYPSLREVLESNGAHGRDKVPGIAAQLGLEVTSREEPCETAGRILRRDRRSTELRSSISAAGPEPVPEVAGRLFPELPSDQRVPALTDLVGLLLRARDPDSGAPLLSARYHFFLRSLEGAFVSYWPRKTVFLERRAGSGEGSAFEVALCRECGQHYFVGPKNFSGGKLTEAIRDPSHPGFGATFFRPIENADYDSEGIGGQALFRLCVRCGELHPNAPQCGHATVITVVREEPHQDEDRADQLARCGSCGYHGSGHDPVREVVHGTDGPHVVITTTLYQRLPEKRKKVLAFADGRQEAAFFAWYLEETYSDILTRNLILRTLRNLSPHTPEGISLAEVATGLRETYRKERAFPPAAGDLQLLHKAWVRVYREFLTDEPRISLEGVGAIRWSVKWPDGLEIPEILLRPPFSLTEEEAQQLLFVVLDFMRADKALELRAGSGVPLAWSDLELQSVQRRVRIGPPRGQKYVQSWDGKTGRRARFLAKLLTRKGLADKEAIDRATKALRAIWESLKQRDELVPSRDRLLIPVDGACRLNPDWWRAYPVRSTDVLYRCDTCSRIQSTSVGNVCIRHGCSGRPQGIRVGELEASHYRVLYEDDLPGILRVEEHTAQIEKEKAREFQRAFKAGDIHVLSCSTTFELGVDLGDLNTIFLRNVPPEAFNYAQRVGRAGRRSEFPGFAVTYCRRRPHDLYHFAEPNRILKGAVRPPTMSLRNARIISRHVAALALSGFFRHTPCRFSKVEALFGDLERPCGTDDFIEFLHQHKGQLELAMQEIVPLAVTSEMGLEDGQWVAKIAGPESSFARAEAVVSSDFQLVRALEANAAQKREYDTAKWASARAKTIAQEDVLSFLSRNAVIPKYGFPVDVVALDAHRTERRAESMEVSLERDLSIAVGEFAPTSKVVANKKLWTSYGLKRVAEREWLRRSYRRCAQHNMFSLPSPGDEVPSERCCAAARDGRYLVPQFGFVTDREKPKEPTGRPAKVFATRPYFARWSGSEPQEVDFGVAKVAKVSPGLMVVLCEGRRGEGFYICTECGAGFRKRERRHKTAFGQGCPGTLEQFSLGHEFVTDTLRLQFCLKPDATESEPVWFAYSLAYALVEGAAEFLEVPADDLNATVAYGSAATPLPPIILYDDVPGGAGLVARLDEEEVLRECLRDARERLNRTCECEDTSCYGCLRSYRNQFAHQRLQRGPVVRYLERALAAWR